MKIMNLKIQPCVRQRSGALKPSTLEHQERVLPAPFSNIKFTAEAFVKRSGKKLHAHEHTPQLFLRRFSSSTTQIKHITNAKGPQIKTNKQTNRFMLYINFNEKPLFTYQDYIN